MPIKHEFVLKTVVRGSNNVEVPTTITNELETLKKDAFTTTTKSDGAFTILIQKTGGVTSDGGIDVEGKLTPIQEKSAGIIHEAALKAVNGNGDDNGKIKIVFVLKN